MSQESTPADPNKGLKIAITVVAVILVAVAIWLAWLFLTDDDTTAPAPPDTTTTAPATPTPTSTEQTPTSSPSADATTTDPTPDGTTPADTQEPQEPAPTGEPEPVEPEPGPAQTHAWEGKATFAHFTAELRQDDGEQVIDGKAGLPVTVCMTSEPSPGHSMTVWLESWYLETSTGAIQLPHSPGLYEPAFPEESVLQEGDCVDGFLTFDMVEVQVDWVNLVYSNELGDRAVWQFH